MRKSEVAEIESLKLSKIKANLTKKNEHFFADHIVPESQVK